MISRDTVEYYESNINLYPNPTTNKIVIKNSAKLEIESISISDLNGQLLFNTEIDMNEIDLSGLSSGIYILKLSSQAR
jgi:hypothetical protein